MLKLHPQAKLPFVPIEKSVMHVHSGVNLAVLGGLPPQDFFQNHAVLTQFQGKPPYFEQILGSGPPSGVKTLLGPHIKILDRPGGGGG